MGFLVPLLEGLGTSAVSGIAGATNTRPASLSPNQSFTLDALLKSLLPQAAGNNPLNQPAATIDPVQQALMYHAINQNQTGANDAVTHALVSRGLGHSGLLADALTQVANQGQTLKNQSDLSLQNQAINIGQQNKQFGLQQQGMNLQTLLGLLNVQNVPKQSGAGGFFAGLAPTLAYSMQNMINNRNSNPMNISTPITPDRAAQVGSTPSLMGF